MTWIATVLFLMTSAFAGIPVLALQENGESIVGEIAEGEYIETISKLKEAMDQKVVVGISAIEDSDSGWKLSKFSLGLGLTGEIGVGPWKYSSALKQRFIYSR